MFLFVPLIFYSLAFVKSLRITRSVRGQGFSYNETGLRDVKAKDLQV